MRVVLDTNILVSACWKPGGLEARSLQMALDGRAVAYITQEIWEEYREVLGRKKFLSRAVAIDAMLDRLQAIAVLVDAKERLKLAMDDDDNRFLECATAAEADYLITGNLRDFPAGVGRTLIVNARGFLVSALGEDFET